VKLTRSHAPCATPCRERELLQHFVALRNRHVVGVSTHRRGARANTALVYPRCMAVLARVLVVAMFVIGCGISDEQDEHDKRGELMLMESSADPPTWAVPYGHEPWSHDEGMSVSRIVERVHHAIRRDPTSGLPRVTGGGYTATFDGEGMHFASQGAGVTVRTA